ncbi:MAG: hypothetical protein AAGF44_10275, partial [Pseudomonadota bacterium]
MWPRFSVASRISLGFGILLFAILSLVAVSYFGKSWISAPYAELRKAANDAVLVITIAGDVAQAQVSATRYRGMPNDDLAHEAEAELRTVQSDLAKARTLFTGDAEALEIIGAAERASEGYLDAFSRLVAERQTKEALIAEHDAKSPSILTAL